MKKYLFLLIFFYPFLLLADSQRTFSEDEDPSLYHHVSVITGHLNLCLQDGIVEGAKSLPLIRTYSSSGALEKTALNPDLKKKRLRGDWLIQGGWNFFPYANIFIDVSENTWEKIKIYLPEPSGNMIVYEYARMEHNAYVFLPEKRGGANIRFSEREK